jgi:hypothetical protein
MRLIFFLITTISLDKLNPNIIKKIKEIKNTILLNGFFVKSAIIPTDNNGKVRNKLENLFDVLNCANKAIR